MPTETTTNVAGIAYSAIIVPKIPTAEIVAG